MGGRGGSSGLGGGFALPKLEGSEKQIKWAGEIRDTYNSRLGYAQKALETDSKDQVARLTLESLVNSANKDKEKEGAFLSVSYTEQVRKKISNDVKEKYRNPYVVNKKEGSSSVRFVSDAARNRWKQEKEKSEKKYNSFLINEYKKVLKSKKNASWWIDHR